MKEKEKMVLQKCICATCPSYEDCSEKGATTELGFCFQTIGKSACIKVEKGCDCPKCPVKAMMDLQNTYFCTRGSEKEQMSARQ